MSGNEFTAVIIGILIGFGWAWMLAEHGFIKPERLEHWRKLYAWRKIKPKFPKGPGATWPSEKEIQRETEERINP